MAGTVERHVARGATPARMKWRRGPVQEGTGTTVHDERAGGLRAARLGTVEPVPGLDPFGWRIRGHLVEDELGGHAGGIGFKTCHQSEAWVFFPRSAESHAFR